MSGLRESGHGVPKRARPDHRQQFDQRQRHDVPRPQRSDDGHRRADATPWRQTVSMSFPKIISGHNGGAARTRLGWRQWRRTAGLPDLGAHPCQAPSACAPHCSRPHKKKAFAAGVPRRRSAPCPGTRAAPCQSDALYTDFAKATEARSVGRGCCACRKLDSAILVMKAAEDRL
jgi:hypothetical protein